MHCHLTTGWFLTSFYFFSLLAIEAVPNRLDTYNRQRDGDNDSSNQTDSTKPGEKVDYVFTRLSTGLIRGRVSHVHGIFRRAHVFQGIPFAEPPIANLRWKQLKPKKPWKGVLDATSYGPACLSNTTETRSPQKFMSEDCIYANVFADPECKRQKRPCPILFYIHGGGFRYDSATMFNETQIVQKYASDGVIFVIAAYRLGAFGFLDLNDEFVVKKNLGMFDILFALRWAKHELPSAFGANPDRITIMGNSGGATAVLFLSSSPLVRRNDFHQAIISSGSMALNESLNLRSSSAIVAHFNCSSSSRREVLDCLRHIPALELLREQQRLETGVESDGKVLKFAGPAPDGRFIPGKNSLQQLQYWKEKPIVITTTRDEMSFLNKGETEHDECKGSMLALNMNTPEVFNACIQRYHSGWKLGEPMGANYERYHAEAVMIASMNKIKGSRSYVGSFNLANYSGHADDMFFFLGLHYVPIETPEEKLMDLYYPSFVKRFLKTGQPDEAWKTIDDFGRGYFAFDFVVNNNGTLVDWPHFVPGNYSDPAAVDFWLRQMPALERNATNERASDNQNSGEAWANRDKLGESLREKFAHKVRHEFSPVGLFVQTVDDVNSTTSNETAAGIDYSPPISAVSDSMEVTNTKEKYNETNDGLEETRPNFKNAEYSEVAEQEDNSLPLSSLGDAPTTAEEEMEEGNNSAAEVELSKVWIAFWLAITIATLFALIILIMVVSRAVYRCKTRSRGGYTYAGPMDDIEHYFTERSRLSSSPITKSIFAQPQHGINGKPLNNTSNKGGLGGSKSQQYLR